VKADEHQYGRKPRTPEPFPIAGNSPSEEEMGHWIPTGIEPTDYDDELGPKLCLKANTQNAIEKIRNIMISHKEGHMTIKNHQNVSIPKTHALTFQFMLQSSVAILFC